MRTTALAVRFGLEVCILVLLAALAAHLPVPLWLKVVLGGLFCAAGATVWGMLLAPKRKHEIGAGGRVFLEAAFFAGSAAILYHIGLPALAFVFLVVAAADRIALALIPGRITLMSIEQ